MRATRKSGRGNTRGPFFGVVFTTLTHIHTTHTHIQCANCRFWPVVKAACVLFLRCNTISVRVIIYIATPHQRHRKITVVNSACRVQRRWFVCVTVRICACCGFLCVGWPQFGVRFSDLPRYREWRTSSGARRHRRRRVCMLVCWGAANSDSANRKVCAESIAINTFAPAPHGGMECCMLSWNTQRMWKASRHLRRE